MKDLAEDWATKFWEEYSRLRPVLEDPNLRDVVMPTDLYYRNCRIWLEVDEHEYGHVSGEKGPITPRVDAVGDGEGLGVSQE